MFFQCNFDASSGNLVASRNNCSFLRIQLSISHFYPVVLNCIFVISIGNVHFSNVAWFLWTRKFWILIFTFVNQTKKANLKRSSLSRKPLKTESLADTFCLVSNDQIIWIILTTIVIGVFSVLYYNLDPGNEVGSIREQNTAEATGLIWKIKFGLKIITWKCREINEFSVIKQLKKLDCALFRCKALTEEAEEHSSSRKTLNYVHCFPQHFFLELPLPACLPAYNRTEHGWPKVLIG